MELDIFFNQQKVIFDQRLIKHKDYLAKTFVEVHSLLGYDEQQIANFKTILYVTFLYHEPEKLKLEQEELREAKELKEKISKKALELSLLLEEFYAVDTSVSSNDFPVIFSLDLIQAAGKRIYAKGGARALHTDEAQDYKNKFLPTIKRLSKNINTYYSCPNEDEILFELHKKMAAIEFNSPTTRQPSARSMTVRFYRHLIDCVNSKSLNKAILGLSFKATAHLINIILDLEGNALMSEEVARKAIYKAKQTDN